MSIETFKIVQTGSPSRLNHKQRKTLIGLGLNRIGRVAEVPNRPKTFPRTRTRRRISSC
jgi:large subunit ribosomal protein L30